MTETGSPVDRTPGATLPRLLGRYGGVLLQDRERLEGLLRDECGSAHRRDIAVLIAAAACEMHPAAVLKGAGLRSVSASLERSGERARQAGVSALPAIQVGTEVFEGKGALERATEALTAAMA